MENSLMDDDYYASENQEYTNGQRQAIQELNMRQAENYNWNNDYNQRRDSRDRLAEANAKLEEDTLNEENKNPENNNQIKVRFDDNLDIIALSPTLSNLEAVDQNVELNEPQDDYEEVQDSNNAAEKELLENLENNLKLDLDKDIQELANENDNNQEDSQLPLDTPRVNSPPNDILEEDKENTLFDDEKKESADSSENEKLPQADVNDQINDKESDNAQTIVIERDGEIMYLTKDEIMSQEMEKMRIEEENRKTDEKRERPKSATVSANRTSSNLRPKSALERRNIKSSNQQERLRRQEEEQKRIAEEKRKEQEIYFRAWLEKKRLQHNAEKEETRRKSIKSHEQIKKEEDEFNERLQKHSDWERNKKLQIKNEWKAYNSWCEEERQNYRVISKEESELAFKRWKRKKRREQKEKGIEEQRRAQITKLVTRRCRKSRALASAIQQANTFKYFDYYGY